jgi:hypothetical protein
MTFFKEVILGFQKTVLTRGKAILVLQGLEHTGQSRVYQRIMKEQQAYVRLHYQIFYEGLMTLTRRERRLLPAEARRIATLFDHWTKSHRKASEGVVDQDEGIAYPDGAIRADITLGELFLEMVARGINIPPKFLELYKPSRAGKMLSEPGSPKYREWIRQLDSIGALEITRKISATNKEFREKATVERYLVPFFQERPEGKGILYYGDSHMPGFMKLLKKIGFLPSQA